MKAEGTDYKAEFEEYVEEPIRFGRHETTIPTHLVNGIIEYAKSIGFGYGIEVCQREIYYHEQAPYAEPQGTQCVFVAKYVEME